jgi:PAS domain S-box-containing protein
VRVATGPAPGGSGSQDEAARAVLGADALLDALFNQSEVGMTVVDRDLRFVRVNELFGILRGRKPADLVGKTIAEALPEVASKSRRRRNRCWIPGSRSSTRRCG